MRPTLFLRAFCAGMFFIAIQVSAFATDYYIDADRASDGDGLSHATAWKNASKVNEHPGFQPGDRILFKRGCAWTRALRPKGNEITPTGTVKYITIGAYHPTDENLPRPVINGGGVKDEDSTQLHYGATIVLRNQSYWIIENITVTNTPAVQSVQNLGLRQGIKIVADDSPATQSGKTVQNIIIRNVTVQDVFGKYQFADASRGKETGGISLFIYRPSGQYSDTEYLRARFKDVIIEDCIVRRVTRCGIFINASFLAVHPEKHIVHPVDGYPVTGLKIRRNIIEDCAGDGVIVRFAKDALVERNRAKNNHSGDEGPQGVEGPQYVGHGVALWCRSSSGTVFQYNHVYGTKGIKDGTAFDADMASYGTIFQYNYSHNNEGGFMLLMRSNQQYPGTIIRYNISQNDGNSANRTFHFSTYPQDVPYDAAAYIYNNTFYIKDTQFTSINPASKIAISNNTSYKTKFYSNIFVQDNDVAIINRSTNFAVWQYNHFENFSGLPGGPANIGNTTGASDLSSPGTGPISLTTIGTRTSTGAIDAGLDVYKIISNASTSNTYKKGFFMEGNGGKDFYGLPVSSDSSDLPNKGAHNGCLNCSSGLMSAKTSSDALTLVPENGLQPQMLYPNPVYDKLSVSNLPGPSYAVQIFDNMGRKVLDTKLINGEARVGELAPGLYVLVFPANPEIQSQRFIKASELSGR